MKLSIFALRLRELRKAAGISKHELAQQTGISHIYLGELEDGLKTPSRQTAQVLAKHFADDRLSHASDIYDDNKED